MSNFAISVRGVAKDFPVGDDQIRVLHDINVDVNAGELTYLVGESGSGKTTLISIIVGILYPTEGRVQVFDTEIYDLSDNDLVRFRLANIGYRYYLDVVALGGEVINLATGMAETHDTHPDGRAL